MHLTSVLPLPDETSSAGWGAMHVERALFWILQYIEPNSAFKFRGPVISRFYRHIGFATGGGEGLCGIHGFWCYGYHVPD